MKFSITSILIFILCSNISAQLKVPGHKFDSKSKKFHFTTSITNAGDKPVAFYVQPNIPDLKNAFRNDSTLIAYLLEGLNKEAEKADIQIKLIKKAGSLFKSVFFNNDRHLFLEDENEQLYALKYSLMGMIWGQPSKNSNDFYKGFIELLVRTPYFDYDDFREVALDHNSFIEVKINDAWVMVDVDPKKPAFINKYKNSPNGYASFEDIVADTSLIEKYDHHQWWSEKYDVPERGDIIEKYKINLKQKSNTVMYSPVFHSEQKMKISGEFVLCPGCEIFWEERGYFLNLEEKRGAVVYDSINLLVMQIKQLDLKGKFNDVNGQVYGEKLLGLVNNYIPDSPIKEMDDFIPFISNELYVMNKNMLIRYIHRKSPLDQVVISVPDSGVNINQLKAPLFITKSESEENIKINGGKTLSSGENNFNVWGSENDSIPVNPSEILYLKDIATVANAKFTCPFNPAFIPFAFGFNLVLSNEKLSENLSIELNKDDNSSK
ncbi:MAG: hypothetical protein WD048_01860 [Chitinophagales bacterium]